jgi:hypothetical protein
VNWIITKKIIKPKNDFDVTKLLLEIDKIRSEKGGSRATSAPNTLKAPEKLNSHLAAVPTESDPPTHRNPYLDELNMRDISTKCKRHTTEEINFYNINKNECLCAECFLRSSVDKKDILNIKKVYVAVQAEMDNYLSQIKKKIEVFDEHEKKVEDKRRDMEGLVSDYKHEIVTKFEEIRKNLNCKEKELLVSADNLVAEKLWDLDTLQIHIKEKSSELCEVFTMIDSKTKQFTDTKLCLYLSAKKTVIENCIKDEEKDLCESITEVHNIQCKIDTTSLNNFINDIHMIQLEINGMKGVDDYSRPTQTETNYYEKAKEDSQKRKSVRNMNNVITPNVSDFWTQQPLQHSEKKVRIQLQPTQSQFHHTSVSRQYTPEKSNYEDYEFNRVKHNLRASRENLIDNIFSTTKTTEKRPPSIHRKELDLLAFTCEDTLRKLNRSHRSQEWNPFASFNKEHERSLEVRPPSTTTHQRSPSRSKRQLMEMVYDSASVRKKHTQEKQKVVMRTSAKKLDSALMTSLTLQSKRFSETFRKPL